MNNNEYKVAINGCVVAEKMTLSIALLMVRTILQENSHDPTIEVCVKKCEASDEVKIDA